MDLLLCLFRLKRDEKGWLVFATTQMIGVLVVTDRRRGAIGVDLNADHLAVCETDANGNCVNPFSVSLVTYGKSRHQAAAIIGDAVARVVAYARKVRYGRISRSSLSRRSATSRRSRATSSVCKVSS